jgi:hypothetical protein
MSRVSKLSSGMPGSAPGSWVCAAASPKRPLAVQSRDTPDGNQLLEEAEPYRPHLVLGEVATRDLGVAGNRVKEVRMSSVATHPAKVTT